MTKPMAGWTVPGAEGGNWAKQFDCFWPDLPVASNPSMVAVAFRMSRCVREAYRLRPGVTSRPCPNCGGR